MSIIKTTLVKVKGKITLKFKYQDLINNHKILQFSNNNIKDSSNSNNNNNKNTNQTHLICLSKANCQIENNETITLSI